MKRFIYIECEELSNRGYNQAVKVYQLTRGFPQFVGGDYSISSASTKGLKAVATMVVCEKFGYKHDGYDFISKNVSIQGL